MTKVIWDKGFEKSYRQRVRAFNVDELIKQNKVDRFILKTVDKLIKYKQGDKLI